MGNTDVFGCENCQNQINNETQNEQIVNQNLRQKSQYPQREREIKKPVSSMKSKEMSKKYANPNDYLADYFDLNNDSPYCMIQPSTMENSKSSNKQNKNYQSDITPTAVNNLHQFKNLKGRQTK